MSEATQDLIGKLLGKDCLRDAIHIAIAPVVAHEKLQPGQHVCFPVKGNTGRIGAQRTGTQLVGIVDPFLASEVKQGERCWLFLYPNTVTGLRHEWAHPAFDGDMAQSEKWLREFAEENFYDHDERKDFDGYAMLLEAAEEGDFCFNSQPDWLYQEGAQEKQDLWKHLEIVRGRQFSRGHVANASYRCSC